MAKDEFAEDRKKFEKIADNIITRVKELKKEGLEGNVAPMWVIEGLFEQFLERMGNKKTVITKIRFGVAVIDPKKRGKNKRRQINDKTEIVGSFDDHDFTSKVIARVNELYPQGSLAGYCEDKFKGRCALNYGDREATK